MMRLTLRVLLILVVGMPAQARDTRYLLKIDEFLHSPEAQGKLGSDVGFFFGSQSTPKVVQQLGVYDTNQKADSFGKSDEAACYRAMLSAMLELRDRAEKLGANSVIKIVSYFKKNEFASDNEFECHAGALIAGVALKGVFVKTAAK